MRSVVFLGALVLAAPAALAAQAGKFTKPGAGTTWAVDPQHSEVTFRIRHLVGRVRGQFTDFKATIVTTGPDWRKGTVNVVIQAKSIDTRNPARDADLRSPRFFSVDSFPTITFESTGIVASDKGFEMGGLLTMKGRTKPITLRGEFRGVQKDPDGKERIAFDGTALVNRRDFGLTWNRVLETGAMLGDDVEIEIALEAVRQ